MYCATMYIFLPTTFDSIYINLKQETLVYLLKQNTRIENVCFANSS